MNYDEQSNMQRRRFNLIAAFLAVCISGNIFWFRPKSLQYIQLFVTAEGLPDFCRLANQKVFWQEAVTKNHEQLKIFRDITITILLLFRIYIVPTILPRKLSMAVPGSVNNIENTAAKLSPTKPYNNCAHFRRPSEITHNFIENNEHFSSPSQCPFVTKLMGPDSWKIAAA